jgi:hypothetical protein
VLVAIVSVYYARRQLRAAEPPAQQVSRSLGRRRPALVEAKLTWGYLTFGPDNRPGDDEMVFIEVFNRSSGPITWTSAGFRLQDGTGWTMVLTDTAPEGRLPMTIAPGGSGRTWVEMGLVMHRGIDLQRPVVGFASLASGDEVDTPPHQFVGSS